MGPAEAPQQNRSGPTSITYADVIVPRRLDRILTYLVPAKLCDRIKVGSLVQVPLGPSRTKGVVVALPTPTQAHDARDYDGARLAPGRLREIAAVMDEPVLAIPPSLLQLTRAVSDYYLAPWGQCLRSIMPWLQPSRHVARSRASSGPSRADMPRDSLAGLMQFPATGPPPHPTWWEHLQTALSRSHHEAYLHEAPVAARWTVLLAAVEEAQARNRTSILIVPEVVRAASLAALARSRWGDRIALLHGDLSPAVRAETWSRVQAGAATVVVGTRSAIFAPIQNVGLICVDEEEDASLKEERQPRYHARDVAWMRARQDQAVLLLGSAHPSLEMVRALGLRRAEGTGDSKAGACGSVPAPAIQLVDLRQLPRGTVLSDPLLGGIRSALAAKTGAILFVNRKGFAPALVCLECGTALHCPRCSVPLTFYRRAALAACRYCGASQPAPAACPSCFAPRLQPAGSGTERLEEELRRLFPQASIGRLDRDTARTAAQASAIRRRAAAGELDILIGTQMLFQGEPLAPVGLVGIPYADAGLQRPDFRSAERTYHGLLDAVSLARPDGTVVLQTAMPAHHAISAVANRNQASFYEQELAFRQALGYPPFSHLISLRVSGKSAAKVQKAAQLWVGKLTDSCRGQGSIAILGPIPATVTRMRGRHRWQILVKTTDAERARQTVKVTVAAMAASKEGRGLRFEVDVDPVEIG